MRGHINSAISEVPPGEIAHFPKAIDPSYCKSIDPFSDQSRSMSCGVFPLHYPDTYPEQTLERLQGVLNLAEDFANMAPDGHELSRAEVRLREKHETEEPHPDMGNDYRVILGLRGAVSLIDHDKNKRYRLFPGGIVVIHNAGLQLPVHSTEKIRAPRTSLTMYYGKTN